MTEALRLGREMLGRVWPNPAVGCVIARDDEIVGRGQTQPGGRPHAERVALRDAGALARGATAYVTLEPCCHWGRTPPCTDAILAAGVARVVVSVLDPDPRVNGGGVTRLREAGVQVSVGLGSTEATATHAGFFMRLREGRPLVVMAHACRGRYGFDPTLPMPDATLTRNPSEWQKPFVVWQGLVKHEGRTSWVRAVACMPIGMDRAAAVSDHPVSLHGMLQALGTVGLTQVAIDPAEALGAQLHADGLVDRSIPERA